MTEDEFREDVKRFMDFVAIMLGIHIICLACLVVIISVQPVKAAEPQVYTGSPGMVEVTDGPLPVKWLGQICYMVNVRIDGEVYELPDTDDRYEMGLRSDGMMVWRKIDPKKARKAAK